MSTTHNLFSRILILKNTPVFASVNTDDLYMVARELVEEAYLSGDRVFDIYDPSDRFFVIQSGRIGISVTAGPPNGEFVSELGSGECFGEMGVLDDEPRSATAHVLEDSILLVLDRAKLIGLLETYPELSLGVLRSLTQRLREANRRVI